MTLTDSNRETSVSFRFRVSPRRSYSMSIYRTGGVYLYRSAARGRLLYVGHGDFSNGELTGFDKLIDPEHAAALEREVTRRFRIHFGL